METIYDPRDYDWAAKDISRWRSFLRSRLYDLRKGRSDLTLHDAGQGFDIHESLIPRRLIPRSINWHWMIYNSINCMILLRDEHIPYPPSRTEAYWLACVRHGKEAVDTWLDGLPWKVKMEKPWRKTHGVVVLKSMRSRYTVSEDWDAFYLSPRAMVELTKYDED